MSGLRRRWGSQYGGWHIQWVDDTTFKIEQEANSITDESMQGWGAWMDGQLEKKFGTSRPRSVRITASALNFSRNDLGDEGARSLVEYLQKREISVQMLRFFRNSIGDIGAWAIGQLLAHSPEPVREVHLSHNRITEQGACSIFEAIAGSGRYPSASERHARGDAKGLAPVWLRMEYNHIDWEVTRQRLDQQEIRWCAADSRDGWGSRGSAAPMVCVHNSYKSQNIMPAYSRGAAKPKGDREPDATPEQATRAPRTGDRAGRPGGRSWRPVDRDQSSSLTLSPGAGALAPPVLRDSLEDTGPEAERLRCDLRDAMELLASARELLSSPPEGSSHPRGDANEVADWISRVDEASPRWRTLLAKSA